ncbi:uncharacterized protein L203_101200 [Cryptococcus depauperatus CBS 7841]|uniref:Uncharacterized protein n=1 Tax=Cryptococcus depauperatus CBS 7841 TaxID=1295531 RepID=A0AAJ8LZY8_9TREE
MPIHHPDLIIPDLPDLGDLPLPHTTKPVEHGGMNLREGEASWPEAGPSTERLDQERDYIDDKGRRIAFGAKAAAAMTGAVMTSLLMTPFDVLKTRLQTVPPHLHSEVTYPAHLPAPQSLPSAGLRSGATDLTANCCQEAILDSRGRLTSNPLACTSPLDSSVVRGSQISTETFSKALSSDFALRLSSRPSAPPTGCLNPSKWAGIWGEPITFDSIQFNRNSAGVLVLPQNSANVVESGVGVASEGGFLREIAAVRREAGIRGLWKGVGTAITMGIPSSAIYMLGYEYISTAISPYFLPPGVPVTTSASNSAGADSGIKSLTAGLTPAPLIAGSLARTLSATAISPIEMFRTRLQALPSNQGSPTYASVTKDMYRLVQDKGIAILYRGLGPTLWRDVPFSGIYWAGFEILKIVFTSHSLLPPLSPIGTSFLSGFLSGTLSALLTQPFDVLKTRRQVFDPAPGCTGAEGRVGTISLIRHVLKTEGWAALYTGMSARCAKIAPACGLMIACYEGVGRLLGGE